MKSYGLIELISKPCEGLNPDGLSWKEIIKRSFDYYGASNGVVSSLKELLRQFRSVNETEFYFWDTGKKNYAANPHSFDESALISEWLEMLFYVKNRDGGCASVKEAIQSLDAKGQEALYHVLSEQWLDGDHLKEGLNTPFIDTFFDGDKTCFKSLYVLKEILPILINFKENIAKSIVDRHAAEAEGSKEGDVEKVVDSATKAITGTPFFDKGLPLEEGEEKCIQYLLKDFDCSSLLDLCLEDLPRAFSSLVNDSIKRVIDGVPVSGFILDDVSAKKITDLKPDLTSSSYLVSAYIDKGGRHAKEMRNLGLKPVHNALPLLFVKSGAIRFNAVIVREKTKVRELTGDELETLIRRDYPVYPSGLYRYSEYDNDVQHSFFLTKEELKRYLRKQTRYLIITFRCRIDIDPKGCLRFETKK